MEKQRARPFMFLDAHSVQRFTVVLFIRAQENKNSTLARPVRVQKKNSKAEIITQKMNEKRSKLYKISQFQNKVTKLKEQIKGNPETKEKIQKLRETTNRELRNNRSDN